MKKDGVVLLFEKYPATAQPIGALAQTLMVAPGPLTRFQREFIAVTTSLTNQCTFCSLSHAAVAIVLAGEKLPQGAGLPELHDLARTDPKLNALVPLVQAVTKKDKSVETAVNEIAREQCTEEEIHQAVLITSFFNMMNRYVDGMRAGGSDKLSDYMVVAQMLATHGYQQ